MLRTSRHRLSRPPRGTKWGYRGREGVVRATRTWLQPYEEFTIELEEIVGSGDLLVSTHRFRATARHTGIKTELRYAYV